MKKLITIITIVNNERIYKEFVENLQTQTFNNYELIKIENSTNQFNSATKAFNSVIDKINTDYACFIHPDIRFIKNDALEVLINETLRINDFGVVGVAGATKGEGNKRIIYSTIVHGSEKKQAGILIDSAVEVQTLDECLFIIKTKKLKKRKFIERNLWHFYSVEYCLQAILDSEKNYVVPCNLWHFSDGKSLDVSYVKGLKILSKEYSKKIPIMYTTVRKWNIESVFGKMYIEYYLIKQIIKTVLIKRR